jgi:Predicted metal-dependent hydrolase of the TIM-barrel fold
MVDYKKKDREFNIVDIHSHYGKFNTFNTRGDDADTMIGIMDRNGIGRTCIAPFIGLKSDAVMGNNLTYAAMRKYPGRISGLACIDPFDKNNIVKELDRCFSEMLFSAIKLHPDMNGLSSESDAYKPVFEYAQHHHLTILWHYEASPSYIEKLALRYVNVNFVLAHYGGAWDGFSHDRVLNLVKSADNIYTDTASSVIYFNAFESLVEYVGDKKVLFGSDMVFLDPAFQLARILGSDIPFKSKEDILGGNALRLLGQKN